MILIALSDYGVTEVAGPSSAPEIMAMAKMLGSDYPGDETAWCGLAMASWCMRAGWKPPVGYLGARNWLTWGLEVKKPTLGDAVVFWRSNPNTWEGHVGLFVAQRGDWIYSLGGNQGNSVVIAAYPASRVLGYRRWGISE